MYRGSSYLLQRDYKAHKNAVTAIMDEKYKLLWDYEPTEQNVDEANELLFNNDKGIYWKIKDSYKGYDEESEGDDVNDMLSIPGGISSIVNIFDVDANTLMYDKSKMVQDIET